MHWIIPIIRGNKKNTFDVFEFMKYCNDPNNQIIPQNNERFNIIILCIIGGLHS